MLFSNMPDSKQDIELKSSSQAVGHAKLDKFDGVGDVERFLDHFDVVAQANHWNVEVQVLQLPTALTGVAFDFYRRLPVDERNTVAKLKAALAKEFGAGALESDYALLFVSRRRQVGESLSDFGEALKSLGRKAYPTFSDQQLDKLCQTHFVNGGLTEALRVQLLLGSTEKETFRELISRARRLEQVLAPSLVRAVGVGQDRAQAEADCVGQSQLQKLTEAVSALERKVEALQREPNKPQSPCPICGETGHWSRNCPKKKRNEKSDKIICFKCKQPGHMARGCANFE